MNENINIICHLALQIPEILQHIFTFCNANDLGSCRQVSKLWELASRREWSVSSTVVFKSNPKLSEFLIFVRETNREDYFSNFEFMLGYYDDATCEIFWRRCGANVRILALSKYTFHSLCSVRRVIFEWTANITSLELGNVSIHRIIPTLCEPEMWTAPRFGQNWNLKKLKILNERSVTAIGISYMELLCHFPGIRTLRVEQLDEKLNTLFKSVRIIRERDPNKLKLERICAQPKLSGALKLSGSELLTTLTDPDLQLRHIHFGIIEENPGFLLQNILKSNCSSLETLHLEGYAPHGRWIDPVPIFNQPETKFCNLTEITLLYRVFSSLSFLRFTPNLVRLSIYIYNRSDSAIILATKLAEMQNVRLEKCREFTFNQMVHVKEIRHLMNWLPNVEDLATPLDNATIALVCQHWSRLTSLKVDPSFVDESGITGLDIDHVRLINDSDRQSAIGISTPARPNISCLKYLQNLFMEIPPSNPCLSIGYATAKLGINKLPDLKQLSLKGYRVEADFWTEFHGRCVVNV